MTNNPEATLRRLYDEVINGGNLEVTDELLAPDYVEHPEEVHGPAEFKDYIKAFREAFPDLYVTLDEVLVSGDRASTRATIRGTHTGEFMGIPATGRSVSFLGVDFGHFRDGLAVERWIGLDLPSLMRQLGASPDDHNTEQ